MPWGFSIAKLVLKGKPLNLFGFYDSGGGIIPPPPPYIIAVNNTTIISTLNGMTYQEGSGPSNESILFKIQASGLSPAAGNITVTPPTDFEVYDGSVWRSTPFTVAYTSGAVTTTMIYKVRLKAGLTTNSYVETLTLSGADAPDWDITLTASVTAVAQFIQATGGTVTTDGDYKIHSFTGDDVFNVTQLSTNPSFNVVQYLVLAGGGGGGGGGILANGAGGGAGGYQAGSGHTITIQSYPVTIGAGGVIGNQITGSYATNGSDSIFDTITAIGGGRAGRNDAVQAQQDGANGGCGGGGAAYIGASVGGTGSQGGNGGGTAAFGSGVFASAGGGGTSANGGNSSGAGSGNGGNGTSNSITGTAVVYGGGGGGGTVDSLAPAGSGGTGGGGNGSLGTTNAQSGTANLGGGGGGGSYVGGGAGNTGGLAGNGGSGIVILRYRYQ